MMSFVTILRVAILSISTSVFVLAQDDGEVRLVDGYNSYSGRLEVFHDGVWGTVCDDGFATSEAEVACKQLGFSGYTYNSFYESTDLISTNTYNEAPYETHIWLDSLYCSGSENRLEDCTHDAWGQHDCSHSEDVTLTCDSFGSDYLGVCTGYMNELGQWVNSFTCPQGYCTGSNREKSCAFFSNWNTSPNAVSSYCTYNNASFACPTEFGYSDYTACCDSACCAAEGPPPVTDFAIEDVAGAVIGIIVGVVVGFIVLAIIVGVIICWCVCGICGAAAYSGGRRSGTTAYRAGQQQVTVATVQTAAGQQHPYPTAQQPYPPTQQTYPPTAQQPYPPAQQPYPPLPAYQSLVPPPQGGAVQEPTAPPQQAAPSPASQQPVYEKIY